MSSLIFDEAGLETNRRFNNYKYNVEQVKDWICGVCSGGSINNNDREKQHYVRILHESGLIQ